MRLAIHSLHVRTISVTSFLCGRRRFSSGFAFGRDEFQVVRLPVGGSGHVELNFVTPQQSSKSRSNNVLVVLPPGPALYPLATAPNDLFHMPTTATLTSLLPSTTLVTLNYRLSHPTHPFPFPYPIHDTATAFTYIADPRSPHNSGETPRISLLGSHIGGSLALVLALTSPDIIHSVAAIEPLVDWTSLDEILRPKSTSRSKAPLPETEITLTHLLSLRSKLFPTPSSYFDPFASPILFLRAPGRDTPETHDSPFAQDEDDLHTETNTDADADAFGPYDDDHPRYKQQKRRKVLRRWPPIPVGRDEDKMMLAHTRIFVRDAKINVGIAGILRGQGEEMVEVMRRACFWGMEKGFGDKRVGLDLLKKESDGLAHAVEWLKYSLGKRREDGR